MIVGLVLASVLTGVFWRLRGHDFADYYKIAGLPIPNSALVANKIFSKYCCSLYTGVVWGLATFDPVIGVIVAVGMALHSIMGWSLEAIKNDKLVIFELCARGLHIMPLFIALWFVYKANPLFGLICGCMGILQWLCYFLPLHEHAKLHTSLFDRLWRGKVESYELIYGWLAVGVSIALAINSIPSDFLKIGL